MLRGGVADGSAAVKAPPAAASGGKKHPWVVPVLPNAAEQRAARQQHGGTPPPSPSARLVFFPWGGGGPSACQPWVMPLAYQGCVLPPATLPWHHRPPGASTHWLVQDRRVQVPRACGAARMARRRHYHTPHARQSAHRAQSGQMQRRTLHGASP
jgi:hypothetical protein